MKYTQEELRVAFSKVENKKHWKGPVKAIINEKEDVELIRESVIHFTGTVPHFEKYKKGKLIVTADGYWNGPCGEC